MTAISKTQKLSSASVVAFKKKYTFKSPFPQCFPFPYDMMKYVLGNPKSSDGLLKLYKTCKYCYSKCQILIISANMDLRSGLQYQITYNYSFEVFKKLKTSKLWFINALKIDDRFCFDFTKIYRSTIKSLAIHHSKITMTEFNMLAAEGNIETFILAATGRIYDEIEKAVTVDAILFQLPNIQNFWYLNTDEKFSKASLEAMFAIKFSTEFQSFNLILKRVSEDFDANLLFEFLLKNAGNFCKINIDPRGQNRETILLKLTTAEDKFKLLKEWQEKSFVFSYSIRH